MQRVSTIEKNKEREEAEEGKRERGSTHGQAARSAARKGRSMEKKSGARLMTEDTGVLWRRHP